jgi:hypothetical protein
VTAAGAPILGLAAGTHDLHERAGANFNALAGGTTAFGDGQILATIGGDTLAAYWETGDAPGNTVNAGVATFPGPRLLFNLDNEPNAGNNGANDFNNLTETGLVALLSSIEFATPLISLPAITGLDPVDPTVVYPGSALAAAFNKPIALTGSGSITLDDTTGSNDVTLDLADPAQVMVSGTELILTPPANLAFGTSFEVVIADNTIQDFASPPNVYGGTAPGQWTFTTAVEEFTAPAIVARSPEDGATRVPLATPIVATFDQNVLLNPGAATVLYEEGFEDDNGNFSGTGDWEWGTPNSDNDFNLVLNGGNGGSANAWATNLGDGATPSGLITPGADSILRGPSGGGGIDLTGVALAQLEFAAAVDFDAGDVAEVRVRETGTEDLLVTLTPFGESPLAATQTADWTSYGPFDISAAAGHNVYLEFRYQGDNGVFAGLYLDDLRVTGLDGAGVITLRNLTNGTDTPIAVDDASQVAVDGNTLTITPAISLTASSNYAVRIGSGVVRNFSDIGFPGISDDTAWNFSTVPVMTLFEEDFSGGLAAKTNPTWTDDDNSPTDFELYGPGGAGVRDMDTAYDHDQNPNTPDIDIPGAIEVNDDGGDVTLTATLTVPDLNGLFFGKLTFFAGVRNTGSPTIEVYNVTDDRVVLETADITINDNDNIWQFNSFSPVFQSSDIGDTLEVRWFAGAGTSSAEGLQLADVTFMVSDTPDPGGETFADWIAGFTGVGGQTGLGDDPDGDGIPNGVENFFGTDPGEFSQGLVAGAVTSGGASFTFTHPQGTLADDLTAVHEWSTDLISFQPAGTVADTTVAFSTSTEAGLTTVTADVSGTIPDKLFVRVAVSQN